ncbi:MAG: HD domain-containing protein [Lachnospiraceae bacterium]|nr:HD domain-containing protein [Lachnospiraceae bacterium]
MKAVKPILKGITSLAVIISVIVAFFSLNSLRGSAAAGERRDILSSGNDYTAILYDSTSGLPTSEANAIVQSSDGFIWLGGYSGFIRYDGSSFYRFDSSSGISSVFSLCTDSKDRIWVGTNENGLALYDHGEITAYGRVDELKSHSIRDLCEDSDGNIIVATTQGLGYVDKDTLELHAINDPQVNSEYITALVGDRSGTIYGLTMNGAVFTMKDLRISGFYNPSQFGDDPVNALYPDNEETGVVYMGTTGSDVLTVNFGVRLKITERRSADPQKNINALLQIDDKLWVAATNGVGYFDEEDKYHELDDIPMNNSIGNIMIDHEGNMWFTSTRQGVMELVPDRFTDISQLADLDKLVINSTCINSGKLYLGTDTGLVILDASDYDRETNELTQMLDDVRIRCIKNDSSGHLWLCTRGELGLLEYDPVSGIINQYNNENGLTSNHVRTMMQRSDGSIAAATSNGLFIIQNGRITDHYGQEDGISTEEILSVEEGPDGRLFLGSDGDGIYVVDGDRVSRLGFDDGLTSGVIMRIKYDAVRDVFWLITSNSIQYIRDDRAVAVTSFPYSNNYDIYFDNDDAAWILSSNGVYITKASELIANENIEYSFYNNRSGLPYISTGNSRSYLDENLHLYISGTTGVCMVDISEDDSHTDSVLLSVPSVEIDDQAVYISDSKTVSMPSGSRRLAINAYVLTYGLGNPRVSYWLENFDEGPIPSTKSDLKNISYTNLDGGRYIFHLNLLNSRTGEIEKSESIEIVKAASIYENLIFWILVMTAGLGVVSLLIWKYFQKRTQALLKKQEEDKAFIDQIMHTFAKCVDLRDTENQGHSFRVAYYSRMLAEKLSAKRGYTEEQINAIYHIALVHDIGKINIPDAILNKGAALNDEEFEIMKTHAEVGEKLLEDVNIGPDLAVGAGYHHERLDGRGYPYGLKGQEIPEVARLIAVADTFDAMYSTRPYRKQMRLSDVIEELKRVRDTQLEGEVVDALVELADENKLDKETVDAYISENIYGRTNIVAETGTTEDHE